jgi:hypothetical protein
MVRIISEVLVDGLYQAYTQIYVDGIFVDTDELVFVKAINGESLVGGRSYAALLVWDDPVTRRLIYAAYCCTTASVGTGTGQGIVITNACPGGLSSNLMMTLEVISGSDDCGLDGLEMPLVYGAACGIVPAGNVWIGCNEELCASSGLPLIIGLHDGDGGIGAGNMELSVSFGSIGSGGFVPGAGFSAQDSFDFFGGIEPSCDPVYFEFVYENGNYAVGCCGGAYDPSSVIKIVVTSS